MQAHRHLPIWNCSLFHFLLVVFLQPPDEYGEVVNKRKIEDYFVSKIVRSFYYIHLRLRIILMIHVFMTPDHSFIRSYIY